MSNSNLQFSTRVALAGAIGLLGACTGQPARVAAPTDQPADARLAARVEEALAGDPGLNGRMIDVSVAGGVVHLSGFVHSTYDLLLVQGDARTVHGVLDVDERQLVIIRGGTPP